MLVGENREKPLELTQGNSVSCNNSLRAAATRASHVANVTELTENFHLAILHCGLSGWSTIDWPGTPKTSWTDVVWVSGQPTANATTLLVNPVVTSCTVDGVSLRRKRPLYLYIGSD